MDGLATLATIFVTSLVVGLSGALMPGPLLTVAVSESATRGFRTGPLLVLGHASVEALVVVGLTAGLSEVFQNGVFSGLIGLLGGGVLLLMGFGTAKGAWRGEVSLKASRKANVRSSGPILTGALVSLANPYWILWWATVGAAYVVWAPERGSRPWCLLRRAYPVRSGVVRRGVFRRLSREVPAG